MEDHTPMDLIDKLPFRQIVHLVDQPANFRLVVAIQVFFCDLWRRRIGKCLDPHHIEIPAAWFQLCATTNAKYRRVVAGIVVGHPAIVIDVSRVVFNSTF